METIKKVLKSKYLPFCIMAIILLVIHYPINKTSDDLWFEKILDNQNIFNFLALRYNEWSSRIIIEAILVVLSNTKVNIIIWKMIDILMFELLAYSIYYLFIKEQQNKNELIWTLIFVVLIIPFSIWNSAGWIATTTNYLWPLSLGMYVFTLLKKNLNSVKIKWYKTILYIFATLYATNQEQMAAIIFGIYTLYFLYNILIKKTKSFLNTTTIIIYLISIVSLAFILTCPGNQVRSIQETEKWYPEYADYGMISKIELGITSMMKYLIIDGKGFFIAFSLTILCFVLKTNKNIISIILGIVPLIGATLTNLLSGVLTNLFPEINNLLELYSKDELIINANNNTQLGIYIPMILYLLILISIVIDLYLIFKNTDKGRLAILIFMAGLASRLIIGFSPTVFASAERTSVFFYYSLIMIDVLILTEMINNNRIEESNKIKAMTILVSTFNILNYL